MRSFRHTIPPQVWHSYPSVEEIPEVGGVPDSFAQKNVPPMPVISSKNSPRTCRHLYLILVTEHTGHPRKNYSHLARSRADCRHRAVRERLDPGNRATPAPGQRPRTRQLRQPATPAAAMRNRRTASKRDRPLCPSIRGRSFAAAPDAKRGLELFSIDRSRTTDVTNPPLGFGATPGTTAQHVLGSFSHVRVLVYRISLRQGCLQEKRKGGRE